MAQQLGELPALLEDMGPSPSTCKEAYTQTRLQFQEILCPFLASVDTEQTHSRHGRHTYL